MRRSLLISLFMYVAILLHPNPLSAQERVHLPGTSATLECYPVEGSAHAAIVCPGGSFFWLDDKHEGVEVAQWLQRNGISAYVLRYRVAGWWAWATHYRLIFSGLETWQPNYDAQAALTYLRDSLHLSDIGIMGFSAGGYVAMNAARNYMAFSWAAPIYPVVSMQSPYTHSRSRRALLGERGQYDPELRERNSLENQIHGNCPPIFLVACKDDPVVDYRNSVLLDSALTANHIPHRFILYNTGGHGFAVRNDKGTPECHAWKEEFLKWFASLPNHETHKTH